MTSIEAQGKGRAGTMGAVLAALSLMSCNPAPAASNKAGSISADDNRIGNNDAAEPPTAARENNSTSTGSARGIPWTVTRTSDGYEASTTNYRGDRLVFIADDTNGRPEDWRPEKMLFKDPKTTIPEVDTASFAVGQNEPVPISHDVQADRTILFLMLNADDSRGAKRLSDQLRKVKPGDQLCVTLGEEDSADDDNSGSCFETDAVAKAFGG